MKNWKALEKVSVEDWLVKLSGRKTFEKMWKPLLKAKLGEAYKETSAAFIWSTIQRMYAARNSGLKKEMFGYVRGGYASILKRFAEVLEEKGVEIRLNSRVEEIEKLEGGRIRIFTTEAQRNTEIEKTKEFQPSRDCVKTDKSGLKIGKQNVAVVEHNNEQRTTNDEQLFDKIILTCPSNIAAKILPQLSENEKQKLENIKYQGIVCASVLTKKSLSEFYVTNITDETPFTGIIEMSALVDKTEFGGNALVYLPKYVSPDDELFEKSDAEIEEIFLNALEKMYSHFDKKDVLEFKISRVRQVFPLPTLEYSANVPPVKTSLENVFIVNSSQITNGTSNVNETIQLAERFFAAEFTEKNRGEESYTKYH